MSALTQTAPLLPRLISASVAIANNAGQIIREIMTRGDLGVVEKEGASDLQTEADRAAQRCIVSSLTSHFPKITIIGEEEDTGPSEYGIISGQSISSLDLSCPDNLLGLTEEEIVVWVDPLDGTSEYTEGLLDHVTVLIGIAAGGKAVGGVIHQPYYNYQNLRSGGTLGRTVWGVVGGKTGGMPFHLPPPNGCIVATTRSHSSSTVSDAVDAVKPTEILRVGGAGHKVMLLLEGKAHVYVFGSSGCKKWDTCAPQAVLEAAGGVLTDIHGNPIPYHASAPRRNYTGVLASAPGQNHAEYISMIPLHVKDNLKA